jgi:mannose-6-phosphate isomerase-like protein (cupin superfamily)
MVVDEEEIAMEPGDAVRVAPSSSRRLHADASSTLVAVGAP